MLEEAASRPAALPQHTSIQPVRGFSSKMAGDDKASSSDTSEGSISTKMKSISGVSSASGAAEIIQNGGLRVLCRTRAQVEAACSVNWL